MAPFTGLAGEFRRGGATNCLLFLLPFFISGPRFYSNNSFLNYVHLLIQRRKIKDKPIALLMSWYISIPYNLMLNSLRSVVLYHCIIIIKRKKIIVTTHKLKVDNFFQYQAIKLKAHSLYKQTVHDLIKLN